MNDQNQQLSKPQFPLLSIPLVIMSLLILLICLLMYGLSDVRDSRDFLFPVAAVTQFIFSIMILFGKKIGLIGLICYGLFIIALAVVIIMYYISQPIAAVTTLPVLAIPTIPLVLIWRNNRNYFLR